MKFVSCSKKDYISVKKARGGFVLDPVIGTALTVVSDSDFIATDGAALLDALRGAMGIVVEDEGEIAVLK